MLTQTLLSDKELIALLKEGNAAAYTMIYNRYFDELYVHAYQRLRDREEAQEVVHELFSGI
ncbi:hypothetical protein H9X96_06235 [Pedobacter sp. N36a]|uniref:RNA polymerase sigma factor n=1 Tax=Pedobacter sp. N36a TaxID=2767996 RepID=UPI001656A89F|nr:hypothetical protein [Pedobacter sp. N36a]MBC8985368.1 hypothetical protein [Pedobacter sp. N36a]